METEKEIRLARLTPAGRDVRIELDDGEVLELAAESLPPALSVDGQPLAPALLRQLRDAAQRKVISRQVFTLINRRLMTRCRVMEKLADRGFDPDLCTQVLERFADQGLLSDRLYAEAWCRDTLRGKAVGAYYLKSKLMGKGIAGALATEVVAEILPPERERQNADTAASKWWMRQRADVDARLLAKGIRHLQGRGFPAVMASQAVRRLAPQKGNDS